MNTTTTVPVRWHQHGEWGGRSFTGELYWDTESVSIWGMLFDDNPREPQPRLRVDNTAYNGPWGGMIIQPNDTWVGQYASGYEHPLSGKFYKGDSHKVGDNPNDLKSIHHLPSAVFNGPLGYLHIQEETPECTADQHELVVAAIRLRQGQVSLYTTGRTLAVWSGITKEEFEGEHTGKVFYA